MNLQSYLGHSFCEQLFIAISFSLNCIIDDVIKFLQFLLLLVRLDMHFVGNGNCIKNALLALSYHLIAGECDFC